MLADEAPPGGGSTVVVDVPQTTWLRVHLFAEQRSAVLGLALVIFILLFSFMGPLIYHTNQVTTNAAQADLAPGGAHLLGTDNVGYDVLGRLMAGGQSSLEVGIGAAAIATVLGTLWGAVAGFTGGWLDSVMMRIADSVLAIPPLLFVLLIGTAYKPSTALLVIEIGLISWVVPARLTRGEALSLRVREFVTASRGVGARSHWIVLRHIIPNTVGTMVVQTTFNVANAIALLAIISYLGLGPAAPEANWGGMLSNGLNYLYDGYWWLVYPAGIAIVLTVLAFNFIGEGLHDVVEVRGAKR